MYIRCCSKSAIFKSEGKAHFLLFLLFFQMQNLYGYKAHSWGQNTKTNFSNFKILKKVLIDF